MRILFYLPVITDRHFEGVVLPLIRLLYRVGEVHVAGPPQWEMTGLTEKQLLHCADMPLIQWHILDGEDHPSLRTAPSDPDELVDYVAAIAPDRTLCRSADTTTPMRFPGRTRFMMEPVIPPFRLAEGIHGGTILDGPRLYDQGFTPALDEAQQARLDTLFTPVWTAMKARFAAWDGEAARRAWLAQAGLPQDKRIIGLPLDVEAANNFFIAVHSAASSNIALIEQIAAHLDEDEILAVTRHPLNLHGDPLVDRSVAPIEPVIARLGGKVRIVDAPGPAGNATASLMQHCDGAIICDSKSFGHAAFFGKPLLRISRHGSAPWMKAQFAMQNFLGALRTGTASRCAEADARAFFAFHYANNVFAAWDPALTPEELLERMARDIVPDRWAEGIARLAP